MEQKSNQIILGGGCFWCIEAAFQRLEGVQSVTSGYSGGTMESPNYHSVCSGATGHAEVVLIKWDDTALTLKEILDCFFSVHDATSLNKQGNDIGTQYRSFIGYYNETQRTTIQSFFEEMSKLYPSPIVTELQYQPIFYQAESEHLNYYNQHKDQPYCQIVIKPKLQKMKSK